MTALRAPSTRLIGPARGRVYFNQIDPNGVLMGFLDLGNAKKFSVTTTPSTTDIKDYRSEASAPYAKFIDQTALDIAMELYEQSDDNMAFGTLGDRTTLTQTSGTATDEVIAAAALTDPLGRAFRTQYRKITLTNVKQGANTLVLGTDYVLDDAEIGLIRILQTSPTVVAGTDITASYTYAALSGANALSVVRGASKGSIEGQILFIPGNTNGPKREYHLHHVTLLPDGEDNLITDDAKTITLKGSVLSDAAGAYGGSVADPFYTMINRG